MLLFIGELFQLVAETFFFGAATQKASEERHKSVRRARHREVHTTLTQVANALNGDVVKPWLRAPRVKGHHEGRDLELLWLGKGRTEVRSRARPWLDLRVRAPGFFERVLGLKPRFRGTSRGFEAWAIQLQRRYDLRSLEITNGRLVAVGTVELDADRLEVLAVDLLELAWATVVPVASATVDAERLVVQSRARTVSLRCPFCHDALTEDAPLVLCAGCEAPHHPTCFEEGGGVLHSRLQREAGSRQAFARLTPATFHSILSRDGWSDS